MVMSMKTTGEGGVYSPVTGGRHVYRQLSLGKADVWTEYRQLAM